MTNELVIGKVYHNRCVLLDTEHLANAGIAKNDYVTLRVSGDAITIRKARVIDIEHCDEAIMEHLMACISSINESQVSMVQHALARRMHALGTQHDEQI